jgi:hypothetical protein
MMKVREAGLEPRLFTARRGEVFIWHASLVHGARPVRNPDLTRKGFLIRFSTRSTFPSRDSSYWKNVRGRLWRKEARLFWKESSEVIERNGCIGFVNPLAGLQPRGASLSEKLVDRWRQLVGRTPSGSKVQ